MELLTKKGTLFRCHVLHISSHAVGLYAVVDHKILCLGLIQSLFEGSMYTFVLEWTPALTPDNLSPANTGTATDTSERSTIPHGYIFAGFMVSV